MNKKWFFNFWINNLRTSFLLVFLIVVAWAFSLYSIPKESSPDIEFWIINVAVVYPWVNPEDMDSLITEKIETEIEDIDWIKKISSTSWVWSSLVSIELETDAITREVLTDIKDKVDNISFPEDAEDPVVVEVSSNSELIYETLLYWDSDTFSDFDLVRKAKLIQDALEWKNWIASIDLWWISDARFWASWGWDTEYEIKVKLIKSKVELLWFSVSQIASIIRANNSDTPIWNFNVWSVSYDFRIAWELNSLEELKNVIISDSWNSQIRLRDIAEFELKYPWDDIKRLGFWSSKQELWKKVYNYTSLVFNKWNWANVFNASAASKKALEELINNDKRFEWLNVVFTKDMSVAIIDDYKTLGFTAISTLILVFITILFFVWLREWIIASLLLPLAFFITFIVLDTMWLSMNFLTNFSLVLTLWIAIDTVIVIIEWASEKLKLGYKRKTAIMIAVRDFKAPLISWTSTTLVAFLPLMFLPWVMWKFLSFIPITVFVTLVAALSLSLTVASAIFIKLMKKEEYYIEEKNVVKHLRESDRELLLIDRKNKKEKSHEQLSLREKLLDKLWKFYIKYAWKTLRNKFARIAFIIIPVVLMILSFVFISPRLWFVVFPQTDEWIINISVKWQTWVWEESMLKYVDSINNIMLETPEINVFYTTVSGNKISIYLDLLKKDIRKSRDLLSAQNLEISIEDELNYLRSEWLELTVAALKWWPPSWSAAWIKLTANSAKDFSKLKDVSDEFENEFNNIDWTKNVFSSSSTAPWQFVFEFDKDKLANIWLKMWDLLNEIYSYTNGTKAGSIKSSSEDNDIKVYFKEFEDDLNPEDVLNILVNTKVWQIRVWDFATFDFKKSVSNIWREDTKILIEVGSEVKKWYLPTDVQPKMEEFAKKYVFPEWISYISWWEWADNAELIVSTVKSLFITLFLIFSILVFQFDSFRQPAIVLFSVILALLWVNVGLFVTWNPYSMSFWIWFIALTWIVVNDAIILIDKINRSIKLKELHSKNITREEYFEQLIMAWRSRLQPIIVTTLTTVFWVLPLALQDEFWAWLWFTIIFWLFVWSFMTLIAVPILYYYLVLKKRIKK